MPAGTAFLRRSPGLMVGVNAITEAHLMKLTGATLNQFIRIGVMASLFIILLKYLAAKMPLPTGAQTAIGSI